MLLHTADTASPVQSSALTPRSQEPDVVPTRVIEPPTSVYAVTKKASGARL